MDIETKETLELIIEHYLHRKGCNCYITARVNGTVYYTWLDSTCPFGRAAARLRDGLIGKFTFTLEKQRKNFKKQVLQMSLDDFGKYDQPLRNEANDRADNLLNYRTLTVKNSTSALDLWLRNRGFKVGDIIILGSDPLPSTE